MRAEEEAMASENLADLYGCVRHTAQDLHAQAAEILDLTKRLEELTKDTPAWYVTTRAMAEARRRVRMNEADGRRR
jgi:hypothetical protein